MSSNADALLPKSLSLLGLAAFGALAGGIAGPVAAQDDASVTETQGNAAASEQEAAPVPFGGRIDLTVTVPKNESDELLEQDCEREADAGRIAGEIVVCRQLGEASDGSWDADDFERRYAQRTQGEQPVDVAGGGIFRGPATVSGLCVIPPCPPEAAIMIDIEGLPEAPAGTDADRIARGLPPLGRDEELSPEEIARRRRALGLEAPPLPDE